MAALRRRFRSLPFFSYLRADVATRPGRILTLPKVLSLPQSRYSSIKGTVGKRGHRVASLKATHPVVLAAGAGLLAKEPTPPGLPSGGGCPRREEKL